MLFTSKKELQNRYNSNLLEKAIRNYESITGPIGGEIEAKFFSRNSPREVAKRIADPSGPVTILSVTISDQVTHGESITPVALIEV